MSIKENIKSIKKELNSEEKFFETLVNLEKYYKKYKFFIWAVAIFVVAYFIISATNDFNKKARIKEANIAFSKVISNSNDTKSLEKLKKESLSLFDLYKFQQAMKSSDINVLKTLRKSKAFGIADMAKYQYAMLSGDNEALADYIKGGGIFFKDIAILNLSATYMKQSKIKKAKRLLEQIDAKSPFFTQAKLLMHFGIAK